MLNRYRLKIQMLVEFTGFIYDTGETLRTEHNHLTNGLMTIGVGVIHNDVQSGLCLHNGGCHHLRTIAVRIVRVQSQFFRAQNVRFRQ